MACSVRVRSEERDWSSLPSDALKEISHRIHIVFDFVRFRTVCKSWRSAAEPGDLSPQLPWLMLHHKNYDTDYRSIFIPSTDTVRHLYLPEARGKWVCGSSHGWLALVGDSEADLEDTALPNRPKLINPLKKSLMSLLNPLTRACISLPPLQIQRWHVKAAAISSSPSSATACTVMVLMQNSTKLGYCRRGADGNWSQWSVIDSGCTSSVEDVAYHGGRFYVMDFTGRVSICDVEPPANSVMKLPELRGENPFLRLSLSFLVESPRVLLLGAAYGSMDIQENVKFYRMDESGEPKWIRDESMQGRALFMCQVQSFSIAAGDIPGCSENSLYLAELDLKGGKKVSLVAYDFKDRRCPWEGHAYGLYGCGDKRHLYTWVVPSR